ncbi:putative monocarboxylate transporter [Acrodontium crateriforme]|uniref:Monocarboxylate transporter n=1 Tax=Acrodontium crateriforme TaxID=150365 RepID=A0AAQ3R410_9PEZI|nr:putative monocarboxylate transporter [Acrodontium crateriforme]
MATSSATSTIELTDRSHAQAPTSESPTSANEADDIAEQSRVADAAVPEGGFAAWSSLAACSVICFWFVGTTYSWGVIQGDLVAKGVSSASTLSFVGSLTIACNAFLAIISAKVLRSIGSRNTALLGILFLASGEIFSSWSVENVGGLFALTGVVEGVGVSLSFMACGTVPAQYFNRKRGLANGIVFASGGLGGAIISFSLDGLLQKLGPAWTLRILGFITLATGLPAAWFVRDRIPPHRRAMIEFSLFKDVRFILLFLAGAVATFPLLVPPFFLPLYSVSIGLSSSTAAALVAAFNFSSAIGRIGAGFLADQFGSINTLFFSLLLSAVSMLAMWPVSTTIGPLITFAIINGASCGPFFALMPTVAGQVFGSARVSVAMGMLVTSWGGGYLLGAPIAGYLLAAYGGQSAGFQAYRPAIFYAGSMALASAGLVGLVRARISPVLFKKV